MIQLLCQEGYAAERLLPYQEVPIQPPTPSTEAFLTRTAIYVEDHEELLRRYPALAPHVDDQTSASLFCAPMIADGVTVGILVVGYTRPRKFTANDKYSIEALAHLGALALAGTHARKEDLLERKRLTLLARLGQRLGASIDHEVAIHEIAQMLATEIADWCSIDTGRSARPWRQLGCAHRDPSKTARVMDIFTRHPVPEGAHDAITRVLGTGVGELHAAVDDAWLDHNPRGQAHSDLLRELGCSSLIAARISARGRTLGALTLARGSGSKPFDSSDFAFSEALGKRIGLALDNARSHRAAIALADLGRLAASSPVDIVLDAAMEALVEQIDVELAEVLELDEDRGVLTPRAGRGWRAELPRREEVAAGGTTRMGFTVESNDVVVAESLPEEERFAKSAVLAAHGVVSAMSVAVPGPIRPFGALAVYSTIPVCFSTNDKQFLRGVANMLSSALARARSEEAVVAERARLQGILASAMDAIIAIDDQQNILLFNQAAEKMFGVRGVDMIGESISRFIPDRFRPAHAEHVRSFGETGSTNRAMGALGTLMGRRADGTEFPIEATISKLVDRGHRIFTVILRDVTERMASEEALRRERDFVTAVLNTVAGLIVVLDHSGRIMRWNPACEQITGYSSEEMIGTFLWDRLLIPEEVEDVRRLFADLEAGGMPGRHENFWVTKSGEKRWIAWSNAAFRGPDGKVELVIGTGLDISDRAKYERELEEADRHKDDFLAMLGHELRNPLGAIQSALLLQRMSKDATRRAKARAVIDRQAKHMSRLIDDLLDVSRIVRGKVELRRESIDLDGVLRAVVDDHESTSSLKGVRVELDLGPESPKWVYGDRARLVQIFGNLLGNAIKFTSAGGSVQLRASTERSEWIVQVVDDGIGMEPDVLRRIFEPFSQGDRSLGRSAGGLGLGLSVVRGLVGLHGGDVAAESAGHDRGSTFTIGIPRSSAPTTGVALRVFPRPNIQRILVVEDNEDAAVILREVLAEAGYEVELAGNAEEAFDRLRSFVPEVVLCDIGLPGTLTGYDVASRVRSDPGLGNPVMIALSGYGRPEDRRRAAEAGFHAHLTKPAELDGIERVIASLMAASADAPAAK